MNKTSEFMVGDTAYIVESNRVITEVTIGNIQGEFCIAKYGVRNESAIRIRITRLFKTREEAEKNILLRKKRLHFLLKPN